MPQSWEYYQQQETGGGVTYPLWWICGLATSANGTASGSISATLQANTLYAIPFDQMRAVTVSKMMINLTTMAGGAGAKCRLGIYKNTSNTNNVPSTLILDAGDVDIATPAPPAIVTIGGLNTALATDTRYWAVLLTNGNAANATIRGLGNPVWPVIYWGTFNQTNLFNNPTGLLLGSQTYGPLPAAFPTVTSTNLTFDYVPAIALAFSAVT